jgi:hypothetical protein
MLASVEFSSSPLSYGYVPRSLCESNLRFAPSSPVSPRIRSLFVDCQGSEASPAFPMRLTYTRNSLFCRLRY